MPRRSIQLSENMLREFYVEKQLTPKEIGAFINCSQATVRSALKHWCIPTRNISEARKVLAGTNAITRELLYELYYEQRLSQEQVANELGFSLATISRKMSEYGLETRSFAEAGLVYPRPDYDGTPTDKAYLIGFRLGDLHVAMPKQGGQSETIRVETSSTKPEQIELVRQLFEPYGHLWTSQPRGKDGKRVDIVCYVNLTFSFLLPKADRIQDWIQTDDNSMAAFAAGYIDAEGSFGLNKGDATFAIDSYDKGIQRRLDQWFITHGIECPTPHIIRPKGSKNSGTTVYRQDLWRLAIYRKRSLQKLVALVEPYMRHHERRQDMQRAIENIRERDKGKGNR